MKKRFAAAGMALLLAAGLMLIPGISFAVEKTPPGGAVDEPLPWSGNLRVENLKEQYDTPVLMAAYRASLPDPILAEAYNIAHAANMLAGTVTQPGEIFSQNKRLGPYNRERGFQNGPMYYFCRAPWKYR